MLWGLSGAVLSIPIMCGLKIILLNMPNRTATFLAGVMEGEPGVSISYAVHVD
eukprot:COSAG01_NODE_4341_length_5118_cov_6.223152_5_plen_53_part_00